MMSLFIEESNVNSPLFADFVTVLKSTHQFFNSLRAVDGAIHTKPLKFQYIYCQFLNYKMLHIVFTKIKEIPLLVM